MPIDRFTREEDVRFVGIIRRNCRLVKDTTNPTSHFAVKYRVSRGSPSLSRPSIFDILLLFSFSTLRQSSAAKPCICSTALLPRSSSWRFRWCDRSPMVGILAEEQTARRTKENIANRPVGRLRIAWKCRRVPSLERSPQRLLSS